MSVATKDGLHAKLVRLFRKTNWLQAHRIKLITAQSWGAQKVVGVDIDDTLIRGAWRRRRTVWSLQEPDQTMTAISTTSKKRRRESTEGSHPNQADYFPMSCEHEFGSLPIPPSEHRGKHAFPHNLSFRTADWTLTEIPEDAGHYNVVVA